MTRMVTRLIIGWLLVSGFSLRVAAEEPAVLNEPHVTVAIVKDLINRLNPSYETVWSFRDGTFSQGVSASLYNVESREIPIASLRLGVATDEALYGGVSLDLPGIVRRWVPQTVKGYAMAGPLDLLWGVAGKYARLGVVGGYTWGDDAPLYGLTAGAALSF